MAENEITDITRRQIADEMTLGGILYCGDINEADFLARMFDLKKLPSTDHRPEYRNAYDDIYQHMVKNNDYLFLVDLDAHSYLSCSLINKGHMDAIQYIITN